MKTSIVVLSFWVLFAIGWIINLVKVISGFIALPHVADIGGMLILRTIGVFTGPVGSILGLFFW